MVKEALEHLQHDPELLKQQEEHLRGQSLATGGRWVDHRHHHADQAEVADALAKRRDPAFVEEDEKEREARAQAQAGSSPVKAALEKLHSPEALEAKKHAARAQACGGRWEQ
eukprot:scaffold4.g4902.t1